MTLQEYIHHFHFGPIGPDTTVHEEAILFLHRYPELLLQTERWNTTFPADRRCVQPAIEDIALMPRLSSLCIGMLINEIVARMPEAQAYVNVGTWHGFSHCSAFPGNENKHCIGVDNFSEFGSPRDACSAAFQKYRRSEKHAFYDMEYREYFQRHTMPIGFYFYDGEHSYENQLEGLEVAEPFLASGAIIMVDDTNWEDPRNATLEFMKRHSGEYEVIADLKTACNMHPTWWNGVMVLRKK